MSSIKKQGGCSMRAEHIKYFLALAENHSITKTAQEFFTTHQSVSKTIRQLEEEMETQLFERSQKGMHLTPQGQLMLPVAQETLQSFHKLRLNIQHLNRCQNMEGTLHLINSPIANAVIAQSLLNDFQLLYPKVHYHIEAPNAADVLRYIALHHSGLGLAAIMQNPVYHKLYQPYIDQVKIYPLLQDEYVCVAGAKNPLAEQKSISFQDFLQFPIAMLQIDGEEELPFTQLLRQNGDIVPTLLSESMQLYVQAIAYGNYVGLASRRSAKINPLLSSSDLVYISFNDALTLDIALLTNAQPELDEVSTAFVEMVKGQCQ